MSQREARTRAGAHFTSPPDAPARGGMPQGVSIMVWCKWCSKDATCPSRREGPTVCPDFKSADGVTWFHTLEDMPPVPDEGGSGAPP